MKPFVREKVFWFGLALLVSGFLLGPFLRTPEEVGSMMMMMASAVIAGLGTATLIIGWASRR